MLLLTWALVALACCTTSVVIASPGDYSPLTGPCEQSETQLGMSGSYAAFVKGYTGDHSCKADWCGMELIFRCLVVKAEESLFSELLLLVVGSLRKGNYIAV